MIRLRNFPFLLRQRPPYPPLPYRWDRGMPEPEAFRRIWEALIWCAFLGLEAAILYSQ